MHYLRPFLLASTCSILIAPSAFADPKVVTSIKPIHSLVSGIMAGAGSADIVVDGGASPHTFSLRPSQARTLENADIIVWVGPRLEAFLEKPISNLGQRAVTVQLDSAAGVTKLPVREGATFEAHDHSHHAGHDDHDDHAKHDDHDDHDDHAKHDDHDDHDDHAKHDDHDDHDDHAKHDEHDDHDDHAKHDDHDDHDDHAKHDEHDDHDDHAKHDDHDDHGDHAFDPHLWLDPQNASIFVRTISDALSEIDPENAALYASNADSLTARLQDLEAEINETLAPVKGNPFIVFHDAYQNLETRFGVPATGSITISPEIPPGAERIREIRDRIDALEVNCVFSEPQFRSELISTVTENTNAKVGVLDPLGTNYDNGPDLYFEMMRGIASAMRECLTPAS
ncbi:MAG: zinc ABC transporter substrate-binding protein [Alphaproteobacteria bacterium]|nr:zinc ABC transporter substrate-binding protein [Alphaproteobacteria bacterium]